MKIKMSWKSMTTAVGVALMLLACNKENTGLMPEEAIILAENN